MDDYLLYHQWVADEIAQRIANLPDPSDSDAQHRIFDAYGVDLDSMSDAAIVYMEKLVNVYLT